MCGERTHFKQSWAGSSRDPSALEHAWQLPHQAEERPTDWHGYRPRNPRYFGNFLHFFMTMASWSNKKLATLQYLPMFCKCTFSLRPMQVVRAPFRLSTVVSNLASIALNWPSAMHCRASQVCNSDNQAGQSLGQLGQICRTEVIS